MMKRRAALISLILMLLLPSVAMAQFSRQGIFGCSRTAAALNGSVGAFSATGGSYVPVADFTVELNTGTLVYLECVLRGIVDRESESVSVGQITKITTFITACNGGNAYFLTRPAQEMRNFTDQ